MTKKENGEIKGGGGGKEGEKASLDFWTMKTGNMEQDISVFAEPQLDGDEEMQTLANTELELTKPTGVLLCISCFSQFLIS